MIPKLRFVIIVFGLVLFGRSAFAECNDPPSPGVNWSGCVLVALSMDRADLSGANLEGLLITGSVMTNTVLRGANLTDTRFATTDLTGTDFSGAYLLRTSFNSVNLSRTKFDAAVLESPTATNVDATDADLSGAQFSDSLEFTVTYCRTRMPDGSIRNDNCE